jgi:hypothetical protein
MKKVKLSQDKLEEYQAFINALNDIFDDLSDGAYLATMESQTREWLKENKIKANALDFYLEHSPKDDEYETI